MYEKFLERLIVIICLSVLLMCGCAAKGLKPKAVQLSPLGRRLMIVPKGNKVGKYVTPDNGVFMTQDVFKLMIEQLKEQYSHKDEKYAFGN